MYKLYTTVSNAIHTVKNNRIAFNAVWTVFLGLSASLSVALAFSFLHLAWYIVEDQIGKDLDDYLSDQELEEYLENERAGYYYDSIGDILDDYSEEDGLTAFVDHLEDALKLDHNVDTDDTDGEDIDWTGFNRRPPLTDDTYDTDGTWDTGEPE
jgi:hypothetical protein